MLFASTFFAALAAAASLPKRDGATISSSQGVRLRAKGISSPDAVAPNQYLSGIHVGAGQSIASFNTKGWVFFRNESDAVESGSIFISSWPLLNINFFQDIPSEPDNQLVMISGSNPNVGLDVSEVDGVLTVTPPTWAICPKALEYYQGQVFSVLRNYKDAAAVPKDCTAIELLPICAEIPEPPAQQAQLGIVTNPLDTPCYVDTA